MYVCRCSAIHYSKVFVLTGSMLKLGWCVFDGRLAQLPTSSMVRPLFWVKSDHWQTAVNRLPWVIHHHHLFARNKIHIYIIRQYLTTTNNLAKATYLDGAVVFKRNLVDIFCHIRQVAARVAQLVSRAHLGPYFGERACRRNQLWYHSKERWWFPIGSPLRRLRYIAIHRLSPTLKSSEGGSLWGEIWEGRGWPM